MSRVVRSTSALMLVLAVGFAAACGPADNDADQDEGVASATGPEGDTEGAGAGAGSDPVDDLLSWAACMREQGIDVPDPDQDGKLIGFELPARGSPDAAVYEQAEDECGTIDAFSGDPPEPMGDAELDQWLAWAQCMRDQGVEMNDPDPEANLPPEPVRDPSVQRGVIDAAMEACTDLLPASATAPRQP